MKKFSWLFSFVLALTFSALVVGGGRKQAPKPKPSKCQRMWATTPEYAENPYFNTNERIIVME